ncbi:DUF4935 domain-containing protein [Actinomadura darangshiensis]|uniref:DUF4935 domain-containing protein n=1 Tax=Actinomadura darangshiensis TaxID=705336 RepID=A0A4R5BXY1_9ACTN|nr:PIN domain-containing protein [Actinomadura darangshiensis]TDD91069.1 DUF4935 domain-containing protein [Actinomadura darangshiensis]
MTDTRRLVVAVDTTEFFDDLTLSKSAWMQVRLWALHEEAQLWVPEVVIREAGRRYCTQVDQQYTKLKGVDRALRALNWERDPQPVDDPRHDQVESLKDGYELWLRQLLGRLGAVILPLPQMGHDEIVRRMLAEERPFRIKGDDKKRGPDGYRDMLIWASIAERAATLEPADTLYFVTGNHNDFCDPGDTDTVALALRADLISIAPEARKAAVAAPDTLIGSIPAIHRLGGLADLAKVLPTTTGDPAALEIQAALNRDGDPVRDGLLADLGEKCESLADQFINDRRDDDRYSSGLDFDELHLGLESPRLNWLDLVPDTLRTVVHGIDPTYEPDLLMATVTVAADAAIEGYIHISEYDHEDGGYSVSLINDYMYEAEGSHRVILSFNAHIDANGDIEFLELEKAVPEPAT